MDSVGVRELRQYLSRYLDRVKAGETLRVTERGEEVARLVPSGDSNYAELVVQYGATPPAGSVEAVASRLQRAPHPAGTTDAFLSESRGDRA